MSEQVQPITMEELKPIPSSFTHPVSGKEYVLRPWDVNSRVWFGKVIGNDPKIFDSIFNPDALNVTRLCKVVYHQFSDEDKRDFLGEKTTRIDDDGFEQDVIITGPEKLMKSFTMPIQFADVMDALRLCMGLSDPVLSKIEAEELKKKESSSKKKAKKAKKTK